MALNLNNIMLGSEDSRRLADFYTQVVGAPNPDWSDEDRGWFGFRAGDGSLAIGPHSEVKGKSQQPGRIMLNFSTPDVRGDFERIKALGADVVAEPYNPNNPMGGGTRDDDVHLRRPGRQLLPTVDALGLGVGLDRRRRRGRLPSRYQTQPLGVRRPEKGHNTSLVPEGHFIHRLARDHSPRGTHGLRLPPVPAGLRRVTGVPRP